MAAESSIEWTDSTINFWWGCTKVGPGCDHCYAETWAKRTGGDLWGAGIPRRKIKSAVATMHKLDNGYSWWAADALIGQYHPNQTRRVFVQSMSDLFDNEVPLEWFVEAWQTITRCNRINIQIVTKRISIVEKRLAAIGGTWPDHAGLMISVVNQEEADRDIPRLLALKAKLGIPWVGLSMEPLLGLVDLEYPETIYPDGPPMCCSGHECGCMGRPVDSPLIWGVDWVIVGGESGRDARPMHPDWVIRIRDQCKANRVPFLFKQWGEYIAHAAPDATWPDGTPISPDLEPVRFERVGKKKAGRSLHGQHHDGYPKCLS